jgi:hypothetical protein
MENNIKIILRAIVWEDVDWIHLARDRSQLSVVVNMIMYLRFLRMARNF